MIRILSTAAFVAAAAFLSPLPAFAQSTEADIALCGSIVDRAVSVDACMRIVHDRRRTKDEKANAWYDLGAHYYTFERYSESVAAYDQSLALRPDDKRTLRQRGAALIALGDRAGGMEDYQSAIRIDPDYADAYNNRGYAWFEVGDFDRAIADYTTVLRLDPAHNRASGNRGDAYAAKAMWASAIADYSVAITKAPDDPGPYSQRGNAYHALGEFDPALDDYDTAIRLDPAAAYALSNRSGIYYDRGDFVRAIADLEAAVALDDSDFEDHYILAISRYVTGDIDGAIAAQRLAAKLEPDDAYVALFGHIFAKAAGAVSPLSDAASDLNMRAWPAPAVWHYLGELDTAALIAAAASVNPETSRARTCEANFYAGALADAGGDADAAKPLLAAAAASCPADFIEAPIAKALAGR